MLSKWSEMQIMNQEIRNYQNCPDPDQVLSRGSSVQMEPDRDKNQYE